MKVLLEHLVGCSAFPNAELAKRHADKYAAIRKAQREAERAAAEAPVAATAPIQEPVAAAENAPAERPVKPDVKEVPGLEWKKPHTIFVCSMADLFHEDVPFEFIDKVMSTIQKTPWHRYQILTKRAQRMAEYFSNADVPSNVWLGVTVENQQAKSRIDILRTMDAPVRFLSCEPLLEDLDKLDLTNINWVIVGGESGVQARPMHPDWVKSIRDQAIADGIPFFFKQWGTWGADGVKRSKKANGKLLDGEIYHRMP